MKNECSIIRDILPLYVENMVSEDTSEFVKEHLESCPTCRAELEKLREPVEVQTEPQPDMDAAPLKRLKKALLMKKVQTILCTAAVLLALFIAVLDALPVIGAGLFLIPMMLYGIIVGDAGMAVGFGLIYLMTIVVRQLLEPRLIGRQLGLYPLATMMAMYAGLQAMGFLGMLLGPLMLLLCKVALTADVNKAADMARRPPIRWPWKQKRTQPLSLIHI